MKTCALCSEPATHFCHQDEAFLCAPCNVNIHSANALASKHKVVLVSEYMGETGSREDVASEASAAAAPFVRDEPPEACVSLHGSDGVVPQLPDYPMVPSVDGAALDGALKMAEGDLYDLGNGWLEKLDAGIDLGALFNSVNSDAGLVPSVEQLQEQQAVSGLGEVPTIDASAAHAKPASPPELELAEDLDLDMDWLVPNGVVPSVPQAIVPAPTVEAAPAAPPAPVARALAVPGSFPMPAPLVKVSRAQAAINRRERIALYREKKKSRTYKKTIRYASRKAYAEVRPRIKGRFATPAEVAQMKAEAAAKAAMGVAVPCM